MLFAKISYIAFLWERICHRYKEALMLRQLFIPIGLMLAIFLFSTPGYGVTIDFEDLAKWAVVDNQYLGLGVDFNGTAVALKESEGLDQDYPPHSGVMVIYNEFSEIIRADAVGVLWKSVGAFITAGAPSGATLTAYDANNNILGTDFVSQNKIGYGEPNAFLSVTAPNIAYMTISGQQYYNVVDDFQFEQIPEPTTLGLLAAGTFGLLGYGWRKKRR